jgi:uncharacterized protein
MTPGEFSIPARDLDAAGKRFRFRLREAWLRGVLEGTEVGPASDDGELDVRLSKSGTDVVVRGSLTAELTLPCARCLQPARAVVKEPISALVVPAIPAATGSRGEEDEDWLSPDEADIVSYDGETVVLDDLVRDELLLGIPMIPLCSERCPGIRPESLLEPAAGSGRVEAVDPRLRPLLRLKKSP